MPPFFDNDPNM